MCLGELVHHVAHEHAGLAHTAVSHDGALERLRGQAVDVGSDGREGCRVFGVQGFAGRNRSGAVHASHGGRRALQFEVDASSARRNIADGRRLRSGSHGGRGGQGRGAGGGRGHGKGASLLGEVAPALHWAARNARRWRVFSSHDSLSLDQFFEAIRVSERFFQSQKLLGKLHPRLIYTAPPPAVFRKHRKFRAADRKRMRLVLKNCTLLIIEHTAGMNTHF